MLTKLLKRAQNGRSKTIFLDTTLDEGTAYANEIIFVIEKKSRQQSVKVYLAPFLSSVMYRCQVREFLEQKVSREGCEREDTEEVFAAC